MQSIKIWKLIQLSVKILITLKKEVGTPLILLSNRYLLRILKLIRPSYKLQPYSKTALILLRDSRKLR